jgi:hypothetical protein
MPARVVFAIDQRIESAPYQTDSVGPWPGVGLGTPARALQLDSAGAVLWAATDAQLVGFTISGDSLTRAGEAPLDAPARGMAVASRRAAVALGEAGVRLFDVTDPGAPHLLWSWTRARFAYDVSLDGSRMFVAAGPEGVYVVDVSGAKPRTIGLARSLGFASAITSLGGYTYILDRRANALRRIRSDF